MSLNNKVINIKDISLFSGKELFFLEHFFMVTFHSNFVNRFLHI